MAQPEQHQPYSPAEELLSAVDDRISNFLQDGARLVHPSFSVASHGQGELVYKDRRLLITPNDEEYREYARILEEAGIPHITNDLTLGDERVVVGEIPRDARVVPQVIRSAYPREVTPRDIFYKLGERLGHLASDAHVLPDDHLFSLNKSVLILRHDIDVMLVPPLGFRHTDSDGRDELREQMQNGLWPQHARFGAVALMNAFERGLDNVPA